MTGHWLPKSEDQSVPQHIQWIEDCSPGIGKTMFSWISFVANGQRARCYKIGILF